MSWRTVVVSSLRAVRFTMVLKHAMTAHRSQGCLRAVRFAWAFNRPYHRRCWACGLRISTFKLFGGTLN